MTSTARGHEDLAQRVTRLFEEQMRDRPLARRAGDVLPTVDAITIEWLNDVLRRPLAGGRVTAFRIEDVSSGTHARHRLQLEYDEAGRAAGMPPTLFTKSLPDVQTRMIAGVTGHARTEGLFYTQLRPELDLEIPHAYQSTVDRASFAALHLLEDVAATRGAVFCDYRTSVSREMAEQMVDLLAVLHGHFHDDPRFTDAFRQVARYDRWFRGGIAKLRVDYYTDMALREAADRIPDRLLARRDEVWPATLAALDVHEQGPPTFLHSDVHIGNWYRTADGRMGLCDWQCAARGHASRDLAYVLSAALEIEDRRSWERELVRRYHERLESSAERGFDADELWRQYRRQMLHALLMWTPTLCHSEHLPDMQPEAASLCMIERMTAAIDDLESLDA
jgi:thiamine kinase-like enzyme